MLLVDPPGDCWLEGDMRLETRFPTTVEVDCLGDLIRFVFDGINSLVSSNTSSTPSPSFNSGFTSTFIGSNVFIGWVVDSSVS